MNKRIKCFGLIICFLFSLTSINTSAQNRYHPMLTQNNDQDYTANVLESPTIYSETANEKPDFYSMHDNGLLASTAINISTLDEVEQNSDIIVQATFVSAVKQEDVYTETGKFLFATTRSSLQVEKVFQGSIKEGDIIPLLEPYYIDNRNDEPMVTHFESYYPSESGKSYIWFLREIHNPNVDVPNGYHYELVRCERGRYPVINTASSANSDVDNMSNRELDLSPNGNAGVYKKIFKDVIDKYMKN